MEAFYLLATILSNFLKSFTLSLLLLFRTLLPRHWSLRSSSNSSESVSLYEGIVWHERRHPATIPSGTQSATHFITTTTRPPNHLSTDQACQIATTNEQVYVYTHQSPFMLNCLCFCFC